MTDRTDGLPVNAAAAGNNGSREKTIIRTSIIGIVANVFLAVFKAAVGLMSHSIAIVLDAVNNISDASAPSWPAWSRIKSIPSATGA